MNACGVVMCLRQEDSRFSNVRYSHHPKELCTALVNNFDSARLVIAMPMNCQAATL